MKVRHASEVKANDVAVAGASAVKIQWLVSREDEPENFCMRLFELAPGGHTPRHDHPWEHEVFILEGEGTVVTSRGEAPLRPHSVVYIPAGQEHQFRNRGEGTLKFLCMVPKDASY